MSTGAEFTNFVFKRLLAADDFSTRLLNFMLSNYRELAVRVFATQGVFDEKITLAGNGSPNQVLLSQSKDFRGTDQLGNILGLAASGSEDASVGQIKVVPIENTLLTTYYLSLKYTEQPVGVQINPRNGVPHYTKQVQAVGVKADPNAVVDNGGSLTFTIDSVCEGGHSHAGRTALVFMKTPVRGAITEAIAIESRTVTWNGLNNRITTAAVFGQGTPSVNPADYSVILLGPTVRKVDTSGTPGHVFIGTIVGTGSGNLLGAGDNSLQNLIDQSLSSLTLYPGGPAWADGVTNPATTITGQLTKIITDLTSTSGQRGLGKITAPARAAWHDAVTNPADRADLALNKIINDLASASGQGGSDKIGSGILTYAWADTTQMPAGSVFDQLGAIIGNLASTVGSRGLGKITAAALANWADGTTNPATSAAAALAKIVTDLTSTSGQRGAGKITAPARSNWLDATTNPAARVDEALEKIITDLTSTSGNRGADMITSFINVDWHDGTSFTPSSIHGQLVQIVESLTIDGKGSDRIDAEALSSPLVGSTPSGLIQIATGSIKDQLQSLVDEMVTGKLLATFAARTYSVRESVITSATYRITDFCRAESGSATAAHRYYAVGDDGAGTATGIRYTDGHPGVSWQSGPAWTGVPLWIRGITHGGDVDQIAVIGSDVNGSWCEYEDDDLAGAFTAMLPVGNTGLDGYAIRYWSNDGNWYSGHRQKVTGTGAVIQVATQPSAGWSVAGSVPSTCRGIYCFASSGSDIVAGGIDSSGNAMILHSSNPTTWSDKTPASPPGQPVTDMVWDAYRSIFWAVLANGDLWFSDQTGQNWTKLVNGLYTSYNRLAVDDITGTMVFSGAPNSRLAVSADGEYVDEFGVGEDINWEDLGVCHYIRGRFMIAAQNDLLIGGTIRNGERAHLWMGDLP